ncbi:hypothetical protein YC2023_116260 [Brassica napus]|uniref:Uncharacterized protein n=2 Tax=Brassica TaxID=3705 RepID=A0A0D3E7Q3_BRAOL
MAASMSSSCYLSSLRLIPFKRTFFSPVNPPFKNLILRPIPSFLRAIVTFQKIPTVIVPPLSASSSSPSSFNRSKSFLRSYKRSSSYSNRCRSQRPSTTSSS